LFIGRANTEGPRAGTGFLGSGSTPSPPTKGLGECCELLQTLSWWGAAAPPPHQLRDLEECCELLQRWFGAEPQLPKGFPLFSALYMIASPNTIM